MSVTTGFNFAAYSRDLIRETVSPKDGIALSVMSSEDMRRFAVVECGVACGKETAGAPWKPVTQGAETKATLWDTRMGNFSLKPLPAQPCATCAEASDGAVGGGGGGGFSHSSAQTNERCMGHYGFVAMPSRPWPDGSRDTQVVYNPMLFDELIKLVRAQCFFCHNLRAPRTAVCRWFYAFSLFDRGLVGEALHFLHAFPERMSGFGVRSAGSRRARDLAMLADDGNGDDDDDDADADADADADGDAGVGGAGDDERLLQQQQPGLSVEESELQAMNKFVVDALATAKKNGLLPKVSDLATQLRAVADIRNDLVREAVASLGSCPRECRRCGAVSPTITPKNAQLYANWTQRALNSNAADGHLSSEERAEIEGEMEFFARERVRLDAYNVRSKFANMWAQPETTDLLNQLFPHLGEPAIPSLLNHQPQGQQQQDDAFGGGGGGPRNAPRDPKMAFGLFFLDCVLVPPMHLRLSMGAEVRQPSMRVGPDECTRKLSDIISFVQAIEELYDAEQTRETKKKLEGNLCNLQLKVAEQYTRVLESFAKKKGLFRSNMMGKRVNQACRSVISPDFTVEPNQLLLPRSFARRLTYPETVTLFAPERMSFLRRCVINGPDVYPGAYTIEIRRPGGFVDVKSLQGRSLQQKDREQMARETFALVRPGSGYEVRVHRHVVDEDRVIFNRQPTLHKPSMMSYRARVLSGLKTIRFHYVSAKSFNADFDGDEMNVHVPQGVECRTELDTIMDANLNYLLATSGKPVRGLIQDHCDAGVLLAARDKFFGIEDFVQLALLGIGPYVGAGPDALRQLRFALPMPAILKPQKLWSGKQIFSVLFRFITMMHGPGASSGDASAAAGAKAAAPAGIATRRQTTVFASAWSTRDGRLVTPEQFRDKMPDNPVIVLDSELLVGVLDKSQTGPTNLSIAHVVYDVFGPHHVGVFFGALGRLLTYGLQKEGFSMAIDDMMMSDDPLRSEMLRDIDVNAHRDDIPLGYINQEVSKLQKAFFPTRVDVPFPHNQLTMMTITGAKGSPTNAVQMNLVIGQQTFDNKRIPRTLSGKTLPSFFAGDQRARSFGFAMGRFVSGIRPAEYTITAMAGREGLIDTAIKTARSGELERCLMKGLESARVHWGGTVRDGDGALLQTRYGGDGLDPSRAASLKEFDMLHRNARAILGSLPEAFQAVDEELKSDVKPIFARVVEEMRSSGAIPHTKSAHRNMERILKARLEWMRMDAGEPVGVLAAQAVGEPSTQMTLNTFHSVGTTVSHVAQGIPRLRELLLHASVKSATVFVPVTSVTNGEMEAIDEIKALMTPVKLAEFFPPKHIFPDSNAWSVARPPASTDVEVVIAFDRDSLVRHQRRCRVSGARHLDAFVRTLQAFAENFHKLMIGKRDRGAGGGIGGSSSKGGRGAAGEDTMLMEPDEFGMDDFEAGFAADPKKLKKSKKLKSGGGDGGGGFDSGADDEDDHDDEDDDGGAGGAGDDADEMMMGFDLDEQKRNKKKKKAQQHHHGHHGRQGSDGDDEDDDDADSSSSSSSSGDEDDSEDDDDPLHLGHADAAAAAAAAAAADDDDDDGTPTSPAKAFGSSASYDSFGVITVLKEKKKYRIAVVSKTDAAGAGSPYFNVSFRFSFPVRTIAVVSDILKEALGRTQLYSAHPQVENIGFQEASGKTPAQLVFSGEGCRLRAISKVLAPYTVFHPGLALGQMTSSDFQDVLRTYGVEAAYGALLKELCDLFKNYAVDSRHLSLVCDTATHHGVWKAFRFSGVAAASASPLYQMTVAASGKFLRGALARGTVDALGSVSSAIMTGDRPRVGTAAANVARSSEAQAAVVQERLNATLKPMRPR